MDMTHGAMVIDGLVCCQTDECDFREENNLEECKYSNGEICESDGVRQAIRMENGERSAV
ncbi:MAG: hypothetical protein GY832_30850 [Chloroflexi bacterium]|nr:hypothetical protein [Chloroflexota bacterium]